MESHIQKLGLAVAAIAISTGMAMLEGPHTYWARSLVVLGVLVLAADGAWIVHQLLKPRVEPLKLTLALGAGVVAILAATGGYIGGRWIGSTPATPPASGGYGAPARLGRGPRHPDPSSYQVKADGLLPRAKIAPCEKPIKVTAEEILNASQRNAAYEDYPYQPRDANFRYKDQCVKWRLPYSDMRFRNDGVTQLTLATEHGGIVGIQVRSEDYPELRLRDFPFASAQYDVHGRIEAIEAGCIFLKDVVMTVEKEGQ